MKRVATLFLVILSVVMLCLCGCESPEEKAARKIRESTEAYEKAQYETWKIERELEYVQGLISNAEGK